MKKLIAVFLLLAATAAAGCFDFERKSTLTGPSGNGLSGLLGNWSSQNLIPSPGTCTDFKWNASELTSTSAKGSFSATCAGDLKLQGNAEGTLSGNVITWRAQGNATAPGLPSCDITLNGTAEILVDSIRIPYSGDTCLGKVSGVESLRKR
jgi:hypothetical protein